MKKWSFIVGILSVLTFVPEVFAFTVTPGRTEALLKPGDKVKTVVFVTNDSAGKVQVAWETKDWFLLPENKKLTVDHWLFVKKKPSFILKPGATEKVPVIVKCPRETQGELVGMVSFAFQSDPATNVLPVISVSFYSQAIGRGKMSGQITDLAVRRWQDRIQVAVGVKSTGNVHLRPSGTISLTDATGAQLAHFAIQEGEPVYPNQDRGYFAIDSLTLKPGHYEEKTSMSDHGLILRATKKFEVLSDGSIQLAKNLDDVFSSDPGATLGPENKGTTHSQ